ncbi:MAG: hypothetical protein WC365_00695 [Candidatus Babeliales bacterium]
MKFLCFELVNTKKRVRSAYIKGDNESAYAAYRAIMGVGVKESHEAVKPWLKEWEGKK